jgi:hypothetical protein
MAELNRKCLKCSEEFQLKPTDKSSNICGKCKASYQRAYARRKVAEIPEDERYKEKYPYGEYKKLRRFTEIRQKLNSMHNREEWQAFFKEQLYKLETDDKAVLTWIIDRRDQDSKGEERDRRIQKTSYEDTRTTHNNTKSWFD